MKAAERSRFRVMVLSPGQLSHPGLALAAARSGGVGLIDAAHGSGASLAQAAGNLTALLARTAAPQEIGIRIRADQREPAQALLDALSARPHVVMVTGAGPELADACHALRAPGRTVLAECGDDADADALQRAGVAVDGVVACGREAGGWVGSSSTFVLLQRLAQRGVPALYARGISGPGTLAACRAAGLAGAVLDDLVLLMPESPLPPEWQSALAELDGLEPAVLGEALGAPCRVLQRPTHAAAKALALRAQQLEAEGGGAEARARWREEAAALVGWVPPDQGAWPVGQAVGAAAASRARSGSTGGLIRDLLAQSRERLLQARELSPLAEGAPLARSHGTRFPIVQGPMTRVSDVPAFAEAVSSGGALPLLALALMRGEQARPLLEQTRDRLAGRPWGVGILGFVPPELREEQMRQMLEVKPPFAVIAGGRPEHAEPLEQAGIRTYLHVPAAALLKAFLQQGARRFVFEGRESGGHVGPLGSFPLWEAMVETLLREVPPGEEEKVHVLFAGGVHDARSGAMVSALAAPLAHRGMRVGVLMGTAYMFTQEAVTSGAILPGFQRELLACTRTVTLESGVGHSNRCAATPFTGEFVELRRRLLREGRPPAEIKQRLDDLSLGRLRVATRGLVRTPEGLVPVDEERQRRDGMYMAGEIAALRHSICTVEELHRSVAGGSAALLAQAPVEEGEDEAPRPRAGARRGGDTAIAIIGMGMLLPKAQDKDAFWQNLLHKVDAIVEVPADRWDWRMYFDPDRKARDKSYSRWGGFADELVIDPVQFGIPPASMKSISPSQVLVLELVRRALEDAGYAKRPFDREHTAVIIANADSGGYLHHQYVVRTLLPMFEEDVAQATLDRLPEWTEETFPGTLANVHAGRVANRFDLGGPNYIVDSACASSLTALDVATAELQSGRSNLAVVGGMDTGLHPYMFLAFSKTQALSPTGRARCFDKAADGIVISEGSVMMILKRLEDAERDGDRVYAVLKGVGASSDGKAMGLTAPRPLGQQRALRRAYEQAGFSPSTLGLYEAHGTGTSLGDRTEVESLTQVLRAEGTGPRACAIGSAKSLLGHTKTTAGLVGVAKAALSLYHRVLPPHAGVEQPLDPLLDPSSPVYLLNEARPWLSPSGHPRRSGVSAFGFGGTNTHAVLEEHTGRVVDPPAGGARWPVELVAVGAPDRASLAAELRSLRDALEAGAAPALADLAYTCALRGGEGRGASACFVVKDLAQLGAALTPALEHLEGRSTAPLPPEVVISGAEGPARGKVAFLFPGQGAQHPDMAREPTLFFDELRASFERADALLAARYPSPLSQYVFPPASFSGEDRRRAEARLTDTHVAQPAIGVVAAGFFDLLARLGLRPDMAAGHSYGEYAALHAAGVLTRDDFLLLSEVRGRAMAGAGGEAGAMAVVHARRQEVEARLDGRPGVVIAGHNAPTQTIVSGEAGAVKALLVDLQAGGIQGSALPVSGAFHSPLMRGAHAPLAEALARAPLHPPQLPVYANASARPYAEQAEAIRAELEGQLLSPVRFMDEVLQMYEDGARVFVELGPGDLTTRMVRQILADRPHVAVALEPRGSGLRGVLRALAELTARGVRMDLPALFRGRDVRALALSRLVEQTRPPAPSPTAWRVNGMYSRPWARPADGWSKRPHLTSESPRAARAAAPDARMAAAFRAYQDSMQQFLRTQEEVMRVFLGGGAAESDLARIAAAAPPPVAVPAPQVPAPALPPPPALEGAEALTRRLVSLVAERTGYPPELLRVDQDLEAELGIDSIKRVEVVDAFLKALPASTAAQLRGRTEQLTRSRTLAAIVELTVQASPAQERAPAEPPPAPAAAAGAPALRLEREALQRGLVELVARRTGYPPEIIGLRQDLEAELGVDSIKRVEILGAFQQMLPAAAAGAVRARMDELGQGRTLAAIVDLVLTSAPSRADAPVAPAPAPQGNGEAGDCPRFVMRASPAELPQADGSRTLRGLYLLTAEPAVSRPVAEALERRGARAALLEPAACASPEELRRAVAPLCAEHGPVTGILHLAPLELAPMPPGVSEWRQYNRRHTKALFQLLKLCGGPALEHVLVASRLGGAFGRNGDCAGLPTGGGAHGLLKTYLLEQRLAVARSVDFDPTSGPDEIAGHLVAELLHPDSSQEVGYLGGCRHVFTAAPAPLSLFKLSAALEPEPGWVVLVTGGARGITAEITRGLARPGMKLVLVGRTPEPGDEPPELAGAADAQVRELWVRRELKGASPRPPAAIEHEVQELLRKREIRRNLEALRQAGAQVEYHVADVADEARFGALLDQLYERHGRLDAVLHGAGMIADKLVADKTPESFDRVFDTKVDSAFILYRRLRPETLRLLMLFGSTAGRFGNPGQGDYSAANEVLNRMAWRMSKEWRSTRVISVNWGPWHGTGMARDAVNQQFLDRGITPISVRGGTHFALDEIRFGGRDAEVIAGHGPWSGSAQPPASRVNHRANR